MALVAVLSAGMGAANRKRNFLLRICAERRFRDGIYEKNCILTALHRCDKIKINLPPAGGRARPYEARSRYV